MARILTVAVLFSGKGTNLENLIRIFHDRTFGERRVKIVPVTNRPDAGGVAAAKELGLDTIVIDHKKFDSRESFDSALVERLKAVSPDLVVMAGFMRIVTEIFTSQIEAINLHPSLLPLFKGANAIEESFRSGMRVGGVTVHRVDSTLDGGEIIEQECVKIEEGDTLESFRKRVQTAEHKILPMVVAKLLSLPYPKQSAGGSIL
ncbi:phosphoribosylglycinamide formyltransferase [Hydrogenimonas sp.]|nr:phosphoribosylglycinamide formyltransferase [Hydrogenimonas sp.]